MKKWFAVLIVIALLTACNGGNQGEASQDDYPTGNIELIVGWGAGGGTDTFARSIAAPLAEELGVSVTVVNQPGASGAIAGDRVVQAKPDGYTLWAISSNYPLNVALGKTENDLSKYIPVARLQNDVGTLQVSKDGKYSTIDDLISAAQGGETVSVGGTGAMGFDQIVLSLLEMQADVKFTYVPYEEAGQMHAALLGGHIDAMYEEIGPTIGMINEGSLVPVLAFAEEPIGDFPDVPTTVSKGWEIVDGQNRGILAPAGTPEPVIEKLEQAIDAARKSDSYVKYESDSYLNIRDGWLNAADFNAQLDDSIENFKAAVDQIQ